MLGVNLLSIIVLQAVIFDMLEIMPAIVEKYPEKAMHAISISMGINSIICIFAGVYIASSLVRLQQTYLWQFNKQYRNNLLICLLIAATLVGLVQFYSLFAAGWSWYVALVTPICIVILSTHLLASPHFLMKAVFPACPFIIFQLKDYVFNHDVLLLLLITITFLSLYVLQNDRVIKKSNFHYLTGDFKQIMNNPTLRYVNNKIADLFTKLNIRIKPRDLTIAIIHPINRYGIPAFWMTILMLTMIYITDNSKLSIADFGTAILAAMLMGVTSQIQLLSKQLKSTAHLFSDHRYNQLKISILNTVDHQVLLQATLYLVIVNAISFLILDSNVPELFIRSAITVTLVALAFLPAMLRLNWFQVNFRLLFIMISYAATCFVFARWHFYHPWQELLSVPVFLALSILITIRLFSIYLWKRQSVEIFMKTYN